MANRLDQVKSDLLDQAAHVGRRADGGDDTSGPASAPGTRQTDQAFLERYYRHVAPEDLADRDPVDIYGAAAAHRTLAAQRGQGTATVRVMTPTLEEHGWASSHTVVQVVTDDMPFLVDSVTMALDRAGSTVHMVVHPQILVRRDVAGELKEILDVGAEDASTTEQPSVTVESWIMVEIDRIEDTDAKQALEDRLCDVLRDVREAVEDWGRLRDKALSLADELDAAALPVSDEEREEAALLLRWLADDHFTFIGYREYELDVEDGEDVLRSVLGSGLGILRSDQDLSASFAKLPPEVRKRAREPELLVLTKANSLATVHRPSYLDYIGVKVFDDAGNVVGERRFLGLLTSTAYTESVLRVPVVRMRARQVIEASGFSMTSHSGKDLLTVLENYPRDELFQTDVDELLSTALAVVQLQERRQLRLFVRRDVYGRYLSCMVFLPRDRYNTTVRERIQRLLMQATGGKALDFTARVTESVLARLHFVVRMHRDQELPELDVPALERRLAAAARDWNDDFADSLAEQVGEINAARLLRTYRDAFPEGYKEDFPARLAVADVLRIEELPAEDGLGMNLYAPAGGAPGEHRFKLYRTGSPLSLTQMLPILSRMGVEVIDERPYDISRPDASGDAVVDTWIYDFGLHPEAPIDNDWGAAKERFQDTFAAVWSGAAEQDGFNALVLGAGLTWQQTAVLRAYAKYLRQTGSIFSRGYLQQTLTDNVHIARMLSQLFEARFDPDAYGSDEERTAANEALVAAIEIELENVVSLDADRILRAFLALIQATLRTNAFCDLESRPSGAEYSSLTFKIAPTQLKELPEPRPAYEFWVYSPRMEGVHLRFGAVARGGLRWSDRREDFRTEILGLVKAQAVKNSVIVPVGAKGGFVCKQLPDPAVDRDAWMAEGIACYRTFMSGMLDVTDNRAADGSVIPPKRVVRHDGDDPYLVVAADKGTASFSDIANEVSVSYGFWLGDAFASGGSVGYDHKAMGITARGAWESVKRHFREMGRDTQREDFTVVGIGDMSGDVFGNGMLCSKHIRLVAAFDHRHVFLDPNPDSATSYAERRRLFELPRSSWADYDPALISTGGGVYPRSAKQVPVSPQVREVLGLPDSVTSLPPTELLAAVLKAPVDLLWNGGIGTYVKGSGESHADVGDKANDAIRVDGSALRCKAVGEGGNLGFTQRGRIEYARTGGRINTDAIDNSAGVDTSDHEVNIKVLLDAVVREGDLTQKQRNELLAEMTDEIGTQVLATNYAQNVALANSGYQSRTMAHVHRSYLGQLEADGEVDRALEALPSDQVLAERMRSGGGLTGPELAVLMAYTKNIMYADLLETELPQDPYLVHALHSYFPTPLQERYPDRIEAHPLRSEIIATTVVNEMVNSAGTTFAYRLGMDTGGSLEDITRAHIVAGTVFGIPQIRSEISALDNVVSAEVQTQMRLAARSITERATRWLVTTRRPPIDIAWQIEFFADPLARLLRHLPEVLVGREQVLYGERLEHLVEAGVPEDLAIRVAGLAPAYGGLGMVEGSLSTGTDLLEVARVHFALGDHLSLGYLLERIVGLPRQDRWQTMARASLRDELHAVQATLATQVLQHTSEEDDAQTRVNTWAEQDEVVVERARGTLREVVSGDEFDLARLSVGLRVLRSLLRSDPS